jgi:hypothetical protein
MRSAAGQRSGLEVTRASMAGALPPITLNEAQHITMPRSLTHFPNFNDIFVTNNIPFLSIQ